MAPITRLHEKPTTQFLHSNRITLPQWHYTFSILLLFICLRVSSQINKTVETEIGDTYLDATVSPVEYYGLLYQSFHEDKSSKNDKFYIDHYTTDLAKIKSEVLSVKHRSFVYNSILDQQTNYTLILNNDEYYALITTDLTNQKSTIIEGELPKLTKVQQFVIAGNFLYIRAIIGKQHSLIQINRSNKSLKEMPIHIGDIRRNELKPQDLQVVEGELLAFVEAEIDKKTVDLFMLKYSIEGQLKQTVNLTRNIKEKIVRVKASIIDGKVLLAGTFSKTKNEYAQGIFFAELIEDKVSNVKFYNFLDLKNFTSAMSNREQKAIDRKKEANNERNKELLINVFMVIHPIVKAKEGYCLSGEVYKPIYTTSYGANGTSYTVLAGYDYTHAIVLKLDYSGSLIWDENLKMDLEVQPNQVNKYTSVSENSAGDIKLIYANRDKVNIKSMNKNGVVIDEHVTDMAKIDDRTEKAKRINSFAEPWYENYFIAYGTRILPGNQSTKRKQVFFFTKISAE